METNPLKNYIGGEWGASGASEHLFVKNPATGEIMAEVPLSPAAEVDRAVRAAAAAFPAWRETPAVERVQYLFRLKRLLDQNLDDLARTVTNECGKTYQEAADEIRRGIQNVEVACGAPILLQGYNNEDVAHGIDEIMIRQPLGVVAAITPFNFPGMIPLWFLPFAIASGNCFILKPSEKVPMTSWKLFSLLEQIKLPKGVVSLVHGSKAAVDALLDHPDVRAISFVGSTPIAKYVYTRATANGKRAQCQGGAKNAAILLPDADVEFTTRIVSESAFGCAGQRCLAASLAVTVGEARQLFAEPLRQAAANRVVGYGLDSGVQMGPVISAESKSRIESLIEAGVREGARPAVDGRNAVIRGREKGNFIRPTILQDLSPGGSTVSTEIFGPVLGLVHVATVEDAIRFVNQSRFGNMACLFTRSGAAARKFRYAVQAGNVGINVGVAAPMAFFPFSGWKDSFFGDLHGQGHDAIEFYTDKKVVIERWPA